MKDKEALQAEGGMRIKDLFVVLFFLVWKLSLKKKYSSYESLYLVARKDKPSLQSSISSIIFIDSNLTEPHYI